MVAAAAPVSRSVDGVHEPVPTSPTRIRRALRAAFAQWELSTEAAENALLVVEELVANAVDHARTPFRLTVDHTGPALRITVRDGCPGPLHVPPFSPRAARGRGLQMIQALTSIWGWNRTASGKTVWAVLPA
jgi:anti-sigma regulatory factor (Ser/Thr protein kinase)